MIVFQCNHCGHRMNVDSQHAGKKARCKGCGQVALVPSPQSRTEQQESIASDGGSADIKLQRAERLVSTAFIVGLTLDRVMAEIADRFDGDYSQANPWSLFIYTVAGVSVGGMAGRSFGPLDATGKERYWEAIDRGRASKQVHDVILDFHDYFEREHFYNAVNDCVEFCNTHGSVPLGIADLIGLWVWCNIQDADELIPDDFSSRFIKGVGNEIIREFVGYWG